MIHAVCLKLHDLINVSPKFEDLFKQSEEQTQEANQFKNKKPVVMPDRPMHLWKSSLSFYWKLEKIFLSAKNFLAEIDQQGLAKDSRQNVIYATQYIKKNIIKDEFLIALATEIDALEILARFTEQIEFNDMICLLI